MYTVRDSMKTEEQLIGTLGKLEKLGIENVQISIPAYTDADGLEKLLRQRGMSADSAYMPTDSMKGPGDSERLVEKAKRECGIFGCDVVRTNSIPAEYRKNADGYRRYAEILDREGKLCRAAGLKYVYHFHAFEFVTFGETRGIDILLSETDAANVYFQPDVFWLTNAGTEPSVSLMMFRGRAFWIHVKDYAIKQLEGVVESVPYCLAPVGEGNLNWPGILRAASEIGIERYVIEQDQCDRDVFDCIGASVDSLHKMGIY